MSDTLRRLCNWYAAQCDGEWEHHYGVTIGTLDNPGWQLTIDLNASIANRADRRISDRGGPEGDEAIWWNVWIEGNKFRAWCDPASLPVVIGMFFDQVIGGAADRR